MTSTHLTIFDGIHAAREIQRLVEPLGFHAALAGSVLIKGVSTKDVDIHIYPHNPNIKRVDERRLIEPVDAVLRGYFRDMRTNSTISRVWSGKIEDLIDKSRSYCNRDVRVCYTQQGTRVDIFMPVFYYVD